MWARIQVAIVVIALTFGLLTPTQAIVVTPNLYTMGFTYNPLDPVDATTYMFGSNLLLTTFARVGKVPMTHRGRIVAAACVWTMFGGVATTETSALSIRLNDTTDFSISAVTRQNANELVWSNTNMDVNFVSGDYWEFKWVTPTWATNPLTVTTGCTVTMENFGR